MDSNAATETGAWRAKKGPLNAIFIELVTLFIALIMAYYVYDGIASMADIEEEGTMPFQYFVDSHLTLIPASSF